MKFRYMAIAALALASTIAQARDTVVTIALQDVLDMPEAKGKLDGSVAFYLAGQPTPPVVQKFGEDVSNKKTNGVGKDDRSGCMWAALSALLSFQDGAKRHQANAVVDLVSYHKRDTRSDPVNIECHAGAVVIGVTLKGTYAKIKK